ncbi:sugar kinase [Mesorhizobium sp. LMG 17147]|uniref:tagatose kinase n=1 Tax=Mesorhizobium sp. LMG 17147 TaxID=2963091 RepID=UPI0020C9B091|nr:sugar kinase [Mesorhizobium sp. LMG 17147]MCP9231796.1 sugar kinase [Mesorhizobium sp. LMG 17147]
MKKVVTIGEIVVEIMATTIGDGFLEPISLMGPFPSGAPAIFIDQVARMGQPCGIVSFVGDDDFGRTNLNRLRQDGVDCSAIGVDPDRPTGSAFVRYRDDGSRDFVFNIRHSACASIAITAEAKALLAEADHLHVMGSSLGSGGTVTAIRESISTIKQRGGTVSFDPNIRKEMLGLSGMREALEYVFSETDLFLPSGDELYLFCNAATEKDALLQILSCGVTAVVIKRGAAGSSFFDAEGYVSMSGFEAEEVDPTGAGDCFGGALVTCWLRGMAPRDALAIANAAGALAVGKRGPMEGAATWDEIEQFLLTRQGSQ